MSAPTASDSLLVVVKQDCPTCRLVEPVLAEIDAGTGLVVYSQDDPSFPDGVREVRHDATLEVSHRFGVHTVPTLVRLSGGRETDRVEGWDRDHWRALTGVADLGAGLPDSQPGCGALNVEPGMAERLALRFGEVRLTARRIVVSEADDPVEIAYDRGWSDGLPVTPPTELRVVRMLAGTTRDPDEVLGLVPPNLVECTVERVAINAVMAGCRPEYLPVVIAIVEAALVPVFTMHGLLCTLHSAGPVIVVNGPVTRRLGMNWGGNALGQGNRANATIGRALQLLVRNVGGGRPGEIDRAIFGSPAKFTFCFAEDETDPGWTPLSVERGFAPSASTVTLFQGEPPTVLADTASRTPEELTRSLAMGLWGVTHPQAANGQSGGALLVLGPGHYDIYREAGWGRAEIREGLWEALRRPASQVRRGAHGVPMGVDPSRGDELVDKFHPESFLIARAGGQGGQLSAIVGGWSGQRTPGEVQPVTKEISER